MMSTTWAFSRSKCLTFLSRSSSSSGSGYGASKSDHSLATYKLESQEDKASAYASPSPYKNPGPRRYGYQTKYKTQGVLPRNERPVRSLDPYKAKNRWTKDRALFGQNDYIDILGDGDVHPADLLTGPKWLIAFKGNELERLTRKMEWEGPRLKTFYPSEWNRVDKRIRYLTRLYNNKRHKRSAD